MKRRELITLLGSTPAVWPLLTLARQANKVFRVGLLSTSNPRSAPVWVAFEPCLQELVNRPGFSGLKADVCYALDEFTFTRESEEVRIRL